MKRFYILTFCFFLSLGLYAQQEAVSGCNDPNGGIQIHFDATMNCATLGDLTPFDTIGFHSGANGWNNVVSWDNGSPAVNQGDGLFVVYIADPEAYYGLDEVTRFDFVFNEGVSDEDDNPWGTEGKAENEAGECVDFFVEMADITATCDFTVATFDLAEELQFNLSPNPMTDETLVQFSNPENKAFQVILRSVEGREMRRYKDVRGEQLRIDKMDLQAGYYLLQFISPDGRVGTAKLAVQ